jgi:hypothetical protein
MVKKRDFGLVICLGILIAAGSYWFVKELPTDSMEYYMDYLGERLVNLVPKKGEKESLNIKYDQLKTLVKEKEIEPENIEKMAAAIINLSNAQDTLSLKQAESLIAIAGASLSDGKQESGEKQKIEPLPEKWENLNARLGTIQELDKKLREKPVISGQHPGRNYRVDSRLNIIIDSRERQNLENEAFIRQLEEEKRLVWMHDMAENLKKELQKLETDLAEKNKEHLENLDLMELKELAQPVIDRGIMIIDSLGIISEINWDSLGRRVEEEIEREYLKQQISGPSEEDRDQ